VVDVDRPPGPPVAQRRGQHLHEPGEHDRRGVVGVDDLGDPREGGVASSAGLVVLRACRERHVVERDAVGLGHGA
jgi:hypothetical protein